MTDAAIPTQQTADAPTASDPVADGGAAQTPPAAPADPPPAAPAATSTGGAPAAGSADGAPDTTSAEAPDTVRDRAAQLAGRAGEALGRAGEAVQVTAATTVTRLRNNATLVASRGHTTIANEVVEKIAGIAAREVPGVYDLGGDVARIFSSVKERLKLGDESAAQGVSVKLEGKNAVIEVVIVLEFGFQVYSVTEAVREKVVTSVESMLGLDVTAVDVVVDDVHIDDNGPIGDDAARAAGYNPVTTAIVVGEAAGQ